ncbi:hypothetical protein F8388_015262 [Cannabis sativa]|uniref:CCHC-type domain-containing protein n=1 Tax=Cannabis sativa TaxID=3483 RepID=A0A7J6EBF4_CANSA|nr:hypothetical protein F8388_019177 [Cannabis sativa]KAF4364571.1 hypothetical protein F8388_015262 [Cannabis sativa]
MGELGEPLQVDNVTKNKDRLQYPRISILVTLSQDFPDKIAFIDEFNHEVELDVKFEWIPLVCYNCSGMGHSSTDCKKKKEKKEPGKQVWVPKKTVIEKQKQIDAEGFQKVSFDHSPILVTIYEDRSYGRKPFRYFNMWKLAPEYDEFASKAWKEESRGSKMFSIVQKLRR